MYRPPKLIFRTFAVEFIMVIMNNLSRIYAISCQDTINPLLRSPVHYPWTIDQKFCTLPLDYWSEVLYTAPGLLIRSPVHYPWTIDQKSCTLPLDYWSEVLYTAPGLLIRSPVHYPWTIVSASYVMPKRYKCIYDLKPTLLKPSRAGAVVQQ